MKSKKITNEIENVLKDLRKFSKKRLLAEQERLLSMISNSLVSEIKLQELIGIGETKINRQSVEFILNAIFNIKLLLLEMARREGMKINKKAIEQAFEKSQDPNFMKQSVKIAKESYKEIYSGIR